MVFGQVLVILGKEGLIGREMFAIDGVKLPSNASKHRSGTRAEFIARAEKLETAATQMLDRHRGNDDAWRDQPEEKITRRITRITNEATRIGSWLNANPKDRSTYRFLLGMTFQSSHVMSRPGKATFLNGHSSASQTFKAECKRASSPPANSLWRAQK